MSEMLRVRLVTPKGPLLDESALSLTACSEMGEFCVLPHHRPILAALRTGRLTIEQADGGKVAYMADKGFFEGGPEHVNIIAQRCIPLDSLNEGELESTIATLESKLANTSSEKALDTAGIEAEIEWNRALLDASQANN